MSAPSSERLAAAAQAVAEVQRRWGLHSLLRAAPLVGVGDRERDALRPTNAPPWWPGRRGAPRPRLVELLAPRSGGLSLALLWTAAAAGDGLVAVVDPPVEEVGDEGRFFPPAAAVCGIDLDRLVVVQPPRLADAVEAAATLVRCEGFEVVLLRLPAASARQLRAVAVGKLTVLAARAGTTLFCLVQSPEMATDGRVTRRSFQGREAGDPPISFPLPSRLGAFADYRLRLTESEWLWNDGDLAGLRVGVAIDKTRQATGIDHHHLVLRLHRRSLDGSTADRLSLDTAILPGRRAADGERAGRSSGADGAISARVALA